MPVLIFCAEEDRAAIPQKNAWLHYHKTRAAKLIFEARGGSHYFANGPAGDGTESELTAGSDMAACNFLCASCCGCAPCSGGVLDGPSGFAKTHAPWGAVGDVALAWLQLFLLGEETARETLARRPDMAKGYESSGL